MIITFTVHDTGMKYIDGSRVFGIKARDPDYSELNTKVPSEMLYGAQKRIAGKVKVSGHKAVCEIEQY